MSNEQLSMYWGPHHLWGQGGRGQGWSKLKLAPLTPRSLPSITNCSCHSPHSQLARPHSQMPMKSLVCIWVPTTSGGKGVGSRWEQAEPCFCHSPHFQLAGPHSQCPMNSLVCIGVPTTSGGKGVGSRWEQAEAGSPHSQITPLAPASSSSLWLAPAHSSSLPMANVCVGSPPHLG